MVLLDTNNYASGSPRLEIDENNGHQITCFPSESGLNGTNMACSDDKNPNTYTDYSTVYNDTLAYETTVKDAYVVQDADQKPGTTDTITDLTFGGQQVVQEPTLSGGHVVLLNNNRVTIAWSGQGATEWQVTMHTPGPLNGRTAIVKTPEAVYSGLEAGHTGWVNIQPLVDGAPFGSAGHVYFTTTHGKYVP